MPHRDPTPHSLPSLLSATGGYLIWGLFPLYWKQLRGIDATELIAHRMVWALAFLSVVLAVQGRWGEMLRALRSPKTSGANLTSGALLTANWLVYVWGVNAGHVIECSLGYFLVPLLNVLLGRFLLHERLRPAQLAAIALATAGVGLLVWHVGRPPWIALALAITFGLYGLMRKRSPLGPLLGLGAETLLLAPVAIGFLLLRWHDGTGALGRVGPGMTAWLLSTGVVTAVPLLLFARGARGLRFTTLGFLQYLTPTCQFLLGWLVYAEPLDPVRAAAFGVIWAGLATYSADALWSANSRRSAAPPVAQPSRA
ncbi:EamA family transporter RarD [Opitutaceae bacterium EW11]|nr:EamA family transporter RarD [Opitutaceae bacterium EW11]